MHRRAAWPVVAMLLLTGCGSEMASSASRHHHSATPVAPTSPATTPDQAVAATLAGLDTALFADVRLGSPPPVTGGAAYPGRWLYATLTDTTGPVPLGVWETELAQGAIAERLGGRGHDLRHLVSGSTLADTAGSDEDGALGTGMGDERGGRTFTAAHLSDDQIDAQARRVLAPYGVNVEEIRVLHPLDPALLVRVSLPDVAAVRGRFASMATALDGAGAGAGLGGAGSAEFEGVYVELDAPAGTPVAISWNAMRSGGGGQWWSPTDAESDLGMFPHG